MFRVKNVLGLLQHMASTVKKGVINLQQSRHNYNDLSGTVWDGRSQRSAPQRRHTSNLRRAGLLPPSKSSGWDGGADKTHYTWGALCSLITWSPELLGPGKGTKPRPDRVCAFVEYLGT